MLRLVILGASTALLEPGQDNTYLLLLAESSTVLIDCPRLPPLDSLSKLGTSIDKIDELVLTHFHPDHVSATPLLLMNMWLLGRQRPLRISGPADCLDRFERMMDLYGWQEWPAFFPVEFQPLPEQEWHVVIDERDFQMISSPGCHLVPSVALRIQATGGVGAAVYSSDSEPCPAIVRLAQGAQVLIHEATGDSPGHSSAAQAGQVAREAGVERLLLVHYPGGQAHSEALRKEARSTFSGEVGLAAGMMVISIA